MRTRGFTLIEILVVVMIIGLIATLAGRHIFSGARAAERRLTLAKCKEYHDAVMTWRMVSATKAWPASLKDLEKPIAPGEGPFLRVETDPWGGEFRLEREGHVLHVCSAGPDRTESTEDDICYVPHER